VKPEQINALLGHAGRGSTVYLAGIGGCGVSGLAHLLLDAGHRVVGSDLVENEEIRQLRGRGAEIHLGHCAQQVRAAKPVLLVHSPAIRADNPELCSAREMNLPVVRRAFLLAALVNSQRGICVAGMHGKTTTSALLAFALEKLGVQPSYAIGAIVPQLFAHARFSESTGPTSRWFVAEADESDGTLCEFRPSHSIVLNVDDEHLDHFANVDAVCAEFQKFVANTKDSVVFCADDASVAELMSKRPNGISYGFNIALSPRFKVQSSKPGTLFLSRITFHVSQSGIAARSSEIFPFGCWGRKTFPTRRLSSLSCINSAIPLPQSPARWLISAVWRDGNSNCLRTNTSASLTTTAIIRMNCVPSCAPSRI
jgi:UDP-N-acetylmuramate-alanine ligase